LGTREGGAWEPSIFTQPNGTVYVATAGPVYRYFEGSIFEDIVPEELWGASSAAFSIAPNGTLWYTTPSTTPGATAGCRSTTQGDTWTCNPVAMPGDLDRVWIQGTGTNTSILQTSQALQAVWYTTTDGGNYTPYATTPLLLGGGTGNMAYDATRNAVWQLEAAGLASLQGGLNGLLQGNTLQLLRIDNQTGLVAATDTDLPIPYALPWLAVDNGTLWTTTESQAQDGSLSVAVARTRDGGAIWQTFPVSHLAKTATLSSVAVHGNRAAVAYYGANTTGAPNAITTTWNYYVAETSNAQDPNPTWIEHVLASRLHHGSLCIGGVQSDERPVWRRGPRRRVCRRLPGHRHGLPGQRPRLFRARRRVRPVLAALHPPARGSCLNGPTCMPAVDLLPLNRRTAWAG
jgi:hypothetical protein